MRLILKNIVNKSNRKLYGAVCILLAFKFNEETHLVESKLRLQQLMKAMQGLDKTDALSASELKLVEFTVYSYLDFSLLLCVEEYE